MNNITNVKYGEEIVFSFKMNYRIIKIFSTIYLGDHLSGHSSILNELNLFHLSMFTDSYLLGFQTTIKFNRSSGI